MIKKHSSGLFAVISVLFLFCVLSTTDISASQNSEYKIPRSSITYFHENEHQQEIKVVAPPVSLARTPVHRNEEPTRFDSENSNTRPFAKTLARMQQRSQQRQAEAKRLGIVLPSQGGDMSEVSPALSRLNKAIKNIINQHAPSAGTGSPTM